MSSPSKSWTIINECSCTALLAKSSDDFNSLRNREIEFLQKNFRPCLGARPTLCGIFWREKRRTRREISSVSSTCFVEKGLHSRENHKRFSRSGRLIIIFWFLFNLSLSLNGQQPVKVLKSLNDWLSDIFLKFKKSKEHIQLKLYMTIKNCQAIQKSCLDLESNAWFTLGSES